MVAVGREPCLCTAIPCSRAAWPGVIAGSLLKRLSKQQSSFNPKIKSGIDCSKSPLTMLLFGVYFFVGHDTAIRYVAKAVNAFRECDGFGCEVCTPQTTEAVDSGSIPQLSA